jgi:AraC-like DNA-binding protein
MISVQYQVPDGPVAAFVSSYYLFKYEGDSLAELERADRAQFRFQLRGVGEYRFAAGHVTPTYPVTIVGPTSAPVTAAATEPQTIFGWGMLPSGWAALMGNHAGDWVDNAIDARTIFGDSIMEVRQQLIDAHDLNEQYSIAGQTAAAIYKPVGRAPFEFTHKVDAWLLSSVDPDVDDLIAITGLSPRQLERNTTRYYGMPPKKLARKYRALRAAHLLAHGDSLNESELALAFYDQSHLIRELKQFTGLTPSQLRSGHAELTQVTMQGRRALKANPLISES